MRYVISEDVVMAYSWTREQVDQRLGEGGRIVSIGQIGPDIKRWLDRRVKAGELVKYRGFWNTQSPHFGLGPLKTIWARPE